ncbi:MAG: dTMP kinase [Prevotellaceae bacterium]|nr:dTMP kinase [Prevotellaceae bacterium]
MFIVLEGLDGAGKSTQMNYLRDYFAAYQKNTQFIHFPRFDAPLWGPLIAKFLRGELGAMNEVSPYLAALIYAGDRNDAAPQIREWLAQGFVVVADRYVYSNVAYQCAKLDDPEKQKELSNWILQTEYHYFGLPKPNLCLFLDVPLSFVAQKLQTQRDGADRAYLQGKHDIHESDLLFQEKVRNVYLSQTKVDPLFEVISCGNFSGAMRSVEDISQLIRSKIKIIH